MISEIESVRSMFFKEENKKYRSNTEAMKEFQSALDTYPDYSDALYGLGSVMNFADTSMK